MKQLKIGIVGGRGYVAGELLRLLLHHPAAEIAYVQSSSAPNERIGDTHLDLDHTELRFVAEAHSEVDVLFLCQGHGRSRAFLENFTLQKNTRVIDLGNDFRLAADACFGDLEFVYGLVEVNRERIRTARAVANPGCFATAIQLALLPLAAAGLLDEHLHVHAITGATGAGAGLRETSHFSYRNNNLSIYKAFRHQHLGEINRTLRGLQEDFAGAIHFLPVRGDFPRGIFASIYQQTELDEHALHQLYQDYYADAAFVHLSERTVHLKQVVNTNYAYLQVEHIDGKALLTCAIDNLLLGAAGRAVQNMNLMCGLPETLGLTLKASGY